MFRTARPSDSVLRTRVFPGGCLSVNISRRKFSQLSLGAGLSLGEHWLLPQGLSMHKAKPLSRSAPSGRPFNARFVDVAQAAGLRAPVIYGGTEEKKYLVEATGCGWAFIQHGNEGWEGHFFLLGPAPGGGTGGQGQWPL